MNKTPPIVLAFMTFLLLVAVAKADNPVINSVNQSHNTVLWGDNITIMANVTDIDGDIDVVIVNFIYPVNETLEMYNLTDLYELGGTYEINYTPNYPKKYTYNVFANDSTGNYTFSEDYNFSVQVEEEVIISVNVAPSCGSGFSFYFVPEEVFREQTVFFLQINENIGNMDINETSEMFLNYYNGTLVWGPLFDDTILLITSEEDLHYGLWNTYNDTPFGTYYWHGLTHFSGRALNGNETVSYPWPDYNVTANCTEPEDVDSDGINETECWYHFKRTCFNNYAKQYDSNTTEVSSVTVPNQNASVPAYHGLVNVTEGYTFNTTEFFNAYTFQMNDCTEYCYACFSNDTTITDEECAYSTEWYGGTIQNDLRNFTVTQLNSDGTNVTFSETFVSCTDRYIISFCEVNYSMSVLDCYDYVQCNGTLELIDDLEVIVSKGGEVEQPSPEPTPEPTPAPRPTPEPAPGQIEINIYPVDPEVSGMQEQLTPVEFVVENLGGRTVSGITLVPIVGSDWIAQNATVDTINPGEKLNRTLFIQPTYKVEPAVYAIPVQAIDANGDVLDMTYFWFEVLPGKFLAKIMIVESPAEITLDSDSLEEIPILVKNIGKMPLTGVKAKLENIENCIINITSPEMELDINEESSLNIQVLTKTGPKTCNAMLIIESKENAYAFAKIKINIAPPSAFLPGGLPLIPLLAIIFLILLIVLIILRRRGKYVGILYPIASAATLILLTYIFLWYLGFVPIF